MEQDAICLMLHRRAILLHVRTSFVELVRRKTVSFHTYILIPMLLCVQLLGG